MATEQEAIMSLYFANLVMAHFGGRSESFFSAKCAFIRQQYDVCVSHCTEAVMSAYAFHCANTTLALLFEKKKDADVFLAELRTLSFEELAARSQALG